MQINNLNWNFYPLDGFILYFVHETFATGFETAKYKIEIYVDDIINGPGNTMINVQDRGGSKAKGRPLPSSGRLRTEMMIMMTFKLMLMLMMLGRVG